MGQSPLRVEAKKMPYGVVRRCVGPSNGVPHALSDSFLVSAAVNNRVRIPPPRGEDLITSGF